MTAADGRDGEVFRTSTLDAIRLSQRTLGIRNAGLVLSSLAFVTWLMPMPVEAAPVGRTLHRAPQTISRAPQTISQAPQTCRPKWPYIVLTCVA